MGCKVDKISIAYWQGTSKREGAQSVNQPVSHKVIQKAPIPPSLVNLVPPPRVNAVPPPRVNLVPLPRVNLLPPPRVKSDFSSTPLAQDNFSADEFSVPSGRTIGGWGSGPNAPSATCFQFSTVASQNL